MHYVSCTSRKFPPETRELAHSEGYPTYMLWLEPCAMSHLGLIFKYFLCPHGQSTLELLFWRNHQSFWENVFKVKLRNGSIYAKWAVISLTSFWTVLKLEQSQLLIRSDRLVSFFILQIPHWYEKYISMKITISHTGALRNNNMWSTEHSAWHRGVLNKYQGHWVILEFCPHHLNLVIYV